MKVFTAVILAALLASGCATTGNGEIERTRGERLLDKYEPYLQEPVDRFTAFRYDSWQPISRTQLVLWTTFSDAYLLTVDNTCPELAFARTVGVTSTTSSISTLDAVLVRGARCQIRQINPIDVRRMRADRHADEAREERPS